MRNALIIGVLLIIIGFGAWWFYGNVIRGWFDPGYTGLSPAEEAARQKAIADFNERANRPVENREPGIRVMEATEPDAGTSTDSSTDSLTGSLSDDTATSTATSTDED
jgi:hypothetical protein